MSVLLSNFQSQIAYGGTLRISGNTGSLCIQIDAAVTGRSLIQEIANYLELTVRGDAGQELVSRNELDGVELHAAISHLLPHSSFTIRYKSDGTPEEIIFPETKSNVDTATIAAVPSISVDATNRAGVAIPTADRAEFIDSLPMLKAH